MKISDIERLFCFMNFLKPVGHQHSNHSYSPCLYQPIQKWGLWWNQLIQSWEQNCTFSPRKQQSFRLHVVKYLWCAVNHVKPYCLTALKLICTQSWDGDCLHLELLMLSRLLLFIVKQLHAQPVLCNKNSQQSWIGASWEHTALVLCSFISTSRYILSSNQPVLPADRLYQRNTHSVPWKITDII